MAKELSTKDVEKLVFQVLRDGVPRNVVEIKAEAERRAKTIVSGNTLNNVIGRLEDEHRLSSEFKRIGGRQYRIGPPAAP